MVKYLKSHTLKDLRGKLKIVYVLNVVDWVATLILLETGLFTEANPVMQPFIESLIWGGVFKLGLPLLLVWYISSKLTGATVGQLKSSNYCVTGCLLFYSFICFTHIIWFMVILDFPLVILSEFS